MRRAQNEQSCPIPPDISGGQDSGVPGLVTHAPPANNHAPRCRRCCSPVAGERPALSPGPTTTTVSARSRLSTCGSSRPSSPASTARTTTPATASRTPWAFRSGWRTSCAGTEGRSLPANGPVAGPRTRSWPLPAWRPRTTRTGTPGSSVARTRTGSSAAYGRGPYPHERYLASVDSIEALTGLDLLMEKFVDFGKGAGLMRSRHHGGLVWGGRKTLRGRPNKRLRLTELRAAAERLVVPQVLQERAVVSSLQEQVL